MNKYLFKLIAIILFIIAIIIGLIGFVIALVLDICYYSNQIFKYIIKY